MEPCQHRTPPQLAIPKHLLTKNEGWIEEAQGDHHDVNDDTSIFFEKIPLIK